MSDAITVIGSINLDITVHTDKMPERGETVIGDKISFMPGGKGANQAVNIARLGKKVFFVAKKGKDIVDNIVMRNLDHPNINLDYFIDDPDIDSGVALVNTIGKRGNKVTLYGGANSKLCASDIENARAAIEQSKVVLISTEIPMEAVIKALEIAKAKNIKTILNIVSVHDSRRDKIKKVLNGVDIVIMNEREGGYLTDRVISHMETGSITGEELRKLGVNHVIITMGKEGNLLINEHGSSIFPGYGVSHVIDTIGGGDAFTGAVAVAIAEEKYVKDAIRFGSAAGALIVTKDGAQDSLSTREEVDAFLEERKEAGGVYSNYSDTIKNIGERIKKMRINIVKMLNLSKSGHPGGSLSAIDIVGTLFLHTMNVDPKNPQKDDRDRFVLSKGHCAPALYAALAEAGYFPEEDLWRLRKIDGGLSGHPDMKKTLGVDMSTGSLGQGLSVANGMAMAAKLKGDNSRTYVLLGDGESQEGQIWEAAMTSVTQKLDNLCAILDFNGLQIDGRIGEVKAGLEPLVEKWKAFNWNVIEIDGHNYEHIMDALEEAKTVKGKPTIIVARTIKGKGVAFMERKVNYHGVAPTDEELKIALEGFEEGEEI